MIQLRLLQGEEAWPILYVSVWAGFLVPLAEAGPSFRSLGVGASHPGTEQVDCTLFADLDDLCYLCMNCNDDRVGAGIACHAHFYSMAGVILSVNGSPDDVRWPLGGPFCSGSS